jgi:outer membrane protein assembly factor BamB
MTDEGFSGPAVKGEVVYVHDHVGEEDVIRALAVATGKEIWRFTYPEEGRENHGFTRATPTIDSGHVYTVSRTGVVHCLEAAKGQLVWRADVMKDHGGEPPEWGAANSAFVDGDQLIAIAAGEGSHLVALNKKTGEKIWAGGGTDIAGYGTPALATLDGRKQYLWARTWCGLPAVIAAVARCCASRAIRSPRSGATSASRRTGVRESS